MEYEALIGLEVHVQLKTQSKAFCGCSTEFGREPNSQVCPVCLGFPGALPVLNKLALEYALKVGIALNCHIREFIKFDRKNYFYPDLPKNYQISQYDLPVAQDGFFDIIADGKPKRINIRRVHLEEDAGKLIHKEGVSLVDFNRAGIPLLEIVSQPELNSPNEAYEYLTSLKGILEYLEVSDCDMEKGSLRCDANISIREKGATALGVKSELKNMNSFKAVKDALNFEISRQRELAESGEKIIQETRLWEAKLEKTVSMRTKEEAKDYRYFPEPDLPPFIITRDKIEETRKTIPELPKDKVQRFMREYGLSEYEAKVISSSKSNADYAQKCIEGYPASDKKPVVNWLIGPMLSEANKRNCILAELAIPAKNLIALIDFVESQQISNLAGKAVLEEMAASGKDPGTIIKEKNLIQISDTKSLESEITAVLKENPKSVASYKEGKTNAVMFLVGQVMKKTAGKANPKVVQDMLKRRLSDA